jgi:thioredoxin 1
MLYTNLKHINSATEYEKILNNNENVVVVCGRMDARCVMVYRVLETFQKKYRNVNFFDFELDNPESKIVLNLPNSLKLIDIPYILYFKNGMLKDATYGLQKKAQFKSLLNKEFSDTANA